jgi:hypothetical protein
MWNRTTDKSRARTLTCGSTPSHVPTLRTFHDGRTKVPFGPDSMMHGVEIIAKIHQGINGQVSMPVRAQEVNHFWEPHSLRITDRHVALF